jgi:hypothetical protein
MAVNVYAWPPVSVTGSEWTEDAPVNASVSAITGKRYVSAHARKRKLARAVVPARSAGGMGAGYCEVLKRLLAGGESLVRLYSWSVNPARDGRLEAGTRDAARIDWTESGIDLDWNDAGTSMIWYDGTILAGTRTTDGGWQAVDVTGLPASTLVARPGEFLTVFADETDTTGQTVQVLTAATSDASGDATIRLVDQLPLASGRINIGTRDTAAFEVTRMPRAVQTLGGDWVYEWSFREVFSDEVAGGFTELDPWT